MLLLSIEVNGYICLSLQIEPLLLSLGLIFIIVLPVSPMSMNNLLIKQVMYLAQRQGADETSLGR